MAKFYVLQVVRIMQMVGNQRHVINGYNPNYKLTSNYYQIFESA